MLKNYLGRGIDYFKAYSGWLFPLAFIFPQSLNVVFFYIGLAFEENFARSLLFIIGNLLFAFTCVFCFLVHFRLRRLSFRSLLPIALALLFFAGGFAIAIRQHGLNQCFLSYGSQFLVFCVPMLLAGLLAGRYGMSIDFFCTIESFSFVTFPCALMYLNAVLFNCLPWNYGANLGILNYMTIAYTFMPFLLAHLINLSEKSEWRIAFSSRKIIRAQPLRAVFIAVYWLAIIGSATRGSLVCVTIFCLLFMLLKALQKQIMPAALVSSAMIAVLFFNLFIYTPSGFYRLSSMKEFLDGLTKHELITAKDSPNINDEIDNIVAQDSDKQIVNLPPTQPSEAQTEQDSSTIEIKNRGTLFKLALMEFQKSPITGMGPISYTVKYGAYPHSVLLEALCETGMIGSFFLFCMLLYATGRMVLRAQQNPEVWLIFLFMLTFGVRANISDCLWICSPLMGMLGYGFGLADCKNETNVSQ